ncbi:MAG: hypothetical protein WKF37_10460 [Bryobacteraceae bacterium]
MNIKLVMGHAHATWHLHDRRQAGADPEQRAASAPRNQAQRWKLRLFCVPPLALPHEMMRDASSPKKICKLLSPYLVPVRFLARRKSGALPMARGRAEPTPQLITGSLQQAPVLRVLTVTTPLERSTSSDHPTAT